MLNLAVVTVVVLVLMQAGVEEKFIVVKVLVVIVEAL